MSVCTHACRHVHEKTGCICIHTYIQHVRCVCVYIHIYICVCVYIYTHRFARGVGRMHRERTIICILEHPLIHLFVIEAHKFFPGLTASAASRLHYNFAFARLNSRLYFIRHRAMVRVATVKLCTLLVTRATLPTKSSSDQQAAPCMISTYSTTLSRTCK